MEETSSTPVDFEATYEIQNKFEIQNGKTNNSQIVLLKQTIIRRRRSDMTRNQNDDEEDWIFQSSNVENLCYGNPKLCNLSDKICITILYFIQLLTTNK